MKDAPSNASQIGSSPSGRRGENQPKSFNPHTSTVKSPFSESSLNECQAHFFKIFWDSRTSSWKIQTGLRKPLEISSTEIVP